MVRGWALAPEAPVSAVEVFVDGRSLGLARLGMARPDVASTRGCPDAAVCGFERIVVPAEIPAASRKITVAAVARDLTGRAFAVGERQVRLSRPSPSGDRTYHTARRAQRLRPPLAKAESGKTNLLVLTHSLGRGGAELWLSETLARLSARPDMSLVVVSRTDGPLRRELEQRAIRVHVSGEHPLASLREYEARLAELASWVGPQGFNVALVNTIVAFPGIELAELLGIPSVFAIHESFDLDAYWASRDIRGWSHPSVRERARRALGTATTVVFEAEATRRQHLRHGDPARFLTIPYGIELGRIERFRNGFDRGAARDGMGIPADAIVVLCLGKVQPRKGQALLAQAFCRLANVYPHARLALVGESTSPANAAYAEGVREYARRAGLSSRVHLLPVVEEPYEWLGVADLMVCASDLESLPRAVLEAMAFDVPVLATRVFGLTEAIEDGRTGWLCAPNDVADLTSSLARVLALPADRRTAVAREGARVVRERHEPEAYGERFARLIEGIAADPRVEPAALVSASAPPEGG